MNTTNKKVITIGVGLVLSFLSINIISCTDIASFVKQSGKDSTTLPDFDILLTDTTTKFNTDKIPLGKPIVLFFFGPDCLSCDTLTRNFVENIDKLKNVRFLMLSVANFHDAKLYEEKYHLNKYDNIILGQDYDNYFNSLKVPGYPLLILFDKNKRIKRARLGTFPIDTIIDIFNK